MNETRTLARFVAETKLTDLPRRLIENLKITVLDTFGAALVGTRQPWAQQPHSPLVQCRCGKAQPQAAKRIAQAEVQSIGTRRTMLGPTRSRISSRLWPVMVRPWFLRPMTARDGSGACRTNSATSTASSSVPQG